MQTRKVLIIDDEPETVSELGEILTDEGFSCQKLTDPTEALDLIEHMTDIGVVITDIRMPRIDGLELIRRMKDRLPPERDIYTIVITGHADMQEAIRALKLGAGDFLTKPLELDHLIVAVKRAQEILRLRETNQQFRATMAHEVRVKTAETRALSEALLTRNQKLEEMNAELESLSRLKSEFLNMLSHELNTPLNAILGFAEISKADLLQKGDDKNAERVDQILTSGTRLHNNVNRILEMAELRGGRGELRPSRTDTDQVIAELERYFGGTARARNVSLSFKAPTPALTISIDATRLHRMIGEAIDNAIRHTPSGRAVDVEMSNRDNHLLIRVRDQGPGMKEGDIAASLDLLRQVDGGMARVNEGMGLGLPLANELAKLHGGHLDIDSIPGQGTTVTISLPREIGVPEMI